ncbi:MAG: bifunctional DNA primase/polymerase [Pseudonocardiaceae bacterium]
MTETSSGVVTKLTPQQLHWRELQTAAFNAVCRGWPVVPGTASAHWCGFVQVSPVAQNWREVAITEPDQVWSKWNERPYEVLMVCGQGVDVLEVPAEIAELLPVLAGRQMAVPVATVLPPARWLLFVATGTGQLLPELQERHVRLRGDNQWVALPPTILVNYAPVRWAVPPVEAVEQCPIALPGAEDVQRALVAALTGPADVRRD